MKTGFATQKVPGGKLLQAEVQCVNGLIESVRITGDFFMHPEEGIIPLEQCFRGLRSDTPVGIFIQKIQHVVEEQKLTLVGVAPQDIAATVLQALVTCML